MIQPTVKPEPAHLEVTAISFRCDYIGDYVTVMVNRDWLANCVWYLKYKSNTSKEEKQGLNTAIKQRIDQCVGPDCPVITKYREKLTEEEFRKT